MSKNISTLLYFVLVHLLCAQSIADNQFNILVYHHVSENTPASTSVSPDQFRQHLQFFKDQNIHVIGLDEALTAVKTGQQLPSPSIALTFDDAYKNIYLNAFPLLKEFNYPFTIFAATDPIDQKFKEMLTWDQLREMKNWGAIIANHSRDHAYLVRTRDRGEHWQTEMSKNISHAQKRLQQELGNDVPNWFAYPYGEFSIELQAQISEMGFTGFGQHSGGVWSGSNFTALPRFAAAGIYANTKTLKTKILSRPMPVTERLTQDMLTHNSQPEARVEIAEIADLSKVLNCFIDGNWQEPVWETEHVFSLTSEVSLTNGRHRYNCTSKSKSGDFYYWYSKPWLILDQNNARN